jgi:hypothetical protein
LFPGYQAAADEFADDRTEFLLAGVLQGQVSSRALVQHLFSHHGLLEAWVSIRLVQQ